MRVFVGAPATDELRDEIGRWRARRAAALPVRWLDGPNLHITLVPPWEEDAIDAAGAALQGVGVAPFSVLFERVEFGPPRAPRLIWADGRAPAALLQLRDAVCAALGRPVEQRPFLLHMTLARFRPEAFARFPQRELHEAVRWRMPLREVVLFASHLQRGGARYEPLRRVTLGDDGATPD